MFKYLSLLLIVGGVFLAGCSERREDSRDKTWGRHEKTRRSRSRHDLMVTRQIVPGEVSTLRLEVEFAKGDLKIERDTTGMLASLELGYDREDDPPRIELDSTSSSPTLRISSPLRRNDHVNLDDLRDNHWRIAVSSNVQLECDIDCGAVDGWLDFTGLKLAGLDIDVGAGELDMEFREPNTERPRMRINAGAASTHASGLGYANLSSLDFDGGAGTSNLAFDGDYSGEGRVDLTFGVGLNTVRIPRTLGVRVRKSGSFLSPISMDGFESQGDAYYSPDYESAAGRLDFHVEMGVGHTSIRWIE